MTAISAPVEKVVVERFAGAPEEWNAFVRSQTNWTFCHLFGWKSVITDVHGHECIYLAARNGGGRLAGVLPLVRVKSLMFGHYLVSVPFLNYGGPLGDDRAVAALTSAAIELAHRGGAKLLELRSRAELPISLAVSHRKVTSLLDLPAGGPDAVWKQLGSDMRTKLRRTQNASITVRFGPDQVEPFFQVFAEHMRELGTPTQPRRLFHAVLDAFPEHAWIGCAYSGDRPVAGGYGFAWNGEYEMTWASSLDAFRSLRVNAYLYWSFIARAASQGISVFNFGRSTPGSGTHEFKRRWGARDQTLWWYNLATVAQTTTPSPQDPAYAWGPRIWKKLPTRLATMLGPQIVRYLP